MDSKVPHPIPTPKLTHLTPLLPPPPPPPESDPSGGHNNSNSKLSPREQDRFLPIANVSRIMKKALPVNAKISTSTKETVQECISEFISFITGDDLLWAMTTLGFEEYVEPLKVYLLRFRDMEGKICCVLFGN
ncbi:nuclear transcription factor Y subunit B-2-like [Camellia sinensis]|uniref:nuclear transcription factor Y subunit B-2-like n=1 Tax=Camellia sinensis TaxID=4442 RepID=UPI00103659AB|nr:nuclear transcription factor Y subunit B-2-like [Camellia sinensis]